MNQSYEYTKGFNDGVWLRQEGMSAHPMQCPFQDPEDINEWRCGLHDGWNSEDAIRKEAA